MMRSFRTGIAKNLEFVKKRSKVLEPEGRRSVRNLIEQIRYGANREKCEVPKGLTSSDNSWMACIREDDAIYFKECGDGGTLQPEIHGMIAGPGTWWRCFSFICINITVRNTDDWEHPIAQIRFEYDERQAGSRHPHPWFHAHLEEMDVPRLMTRPTDFLFALLIVSANYFPSKYKESLRDPAFRSAIIRHENLLWSDLDTLCNKWVCNETRNWSVFDQLRFYGPTDGRILARGNSAFTMRHNPNLAQDDE